MRPPQPPAHPLFGHIPALARDRLTFYREAHARHGDVIALRMGARRVGTAIFHPDDVRRVFVDHARNYPRGRNSDRLKPMVGESLLTLEGERWKQRRVMMQPQYHHQRIAGLAGVMTELTGRAISRWRDLAARGAPIDLAEEITTLTLAIVTKTLLGTDIDRVDGAQAGAAISTSLEISTRRIFSLVQAPAWLPTPANLAFARARRALDGVIFEIIAQRRAAVDEAPDLLAMLLATRDEATGAGLDDGQIRDEAVTTFVAGHETTAAALAWTVWLLAQHPEAFARVRAEVDAALGGRTPEAGDLAALPFTGMAIDEAMRLYPPVPSLSRGVLADDVLGGFDVPAGSLVVVVPWVTHRHAAFWEEPEAYRPERFAPESVKTRHRHAFFPFGGGAHLCIGNNFALMEARLILAMIAQAFDVALVPGARVTPKATITLRPAGGMPAMLTAR